MSKTILNKLSWLGHASFFLDLDRKIYIDPWKIEGGEKADIILVSHAHYDHFSKEDIEKLLKDDTIIVTTADVAKALTGNVKTVAPGEVLKLDTIKITAVHAYNPDKKFHPKDKGWVGFVIEAPEGSLYYTGDTDLIPEFSQVTQMKVDVALLPVGGTYTMNAQEAVQAANVIKPEIAIPYHFGDIVGTKTDARQFKSEYDGEAKILSPVSY